MLLGNGGLNRFPQSFSCPYMVHVTNMMHAAFVCSSAIGMAVGPLISFPLQRVPDTVRHGIRINPITCAGFTMAGAWLLFALVCQLFFEEPLDAIRCVKALCMSLGARKGPARKLGRQTLQF